MCECHDSQKEHDAWLGKEMEYWKWYFGDSVRVSVETERLLKQDGIDPADLDSIRRLK